VDDRDRRSAEPFARDLTIWRDFAGGTTTSGGSIVKPGELAEAELVLGLCDRFHCIPEVAEEMDAGVLRLLKIEELGTRREEAIDPEWPTS
jgi:hypothetical protein